MSGKDMKLSRCRETPPCGSPVLDAREHRRWHERVFISDERTPALHRPRFVGMDDEVDEVPAAGDGHPKRHERES